MRTIFIFLAGVVFLGCEEEAYREFNDFYEVIVADEILLTADRKLFFEGESGIELNVIVRDKFNQELLVVEPDILVNGDTLGSLTFVPQQQGDYRIQAVLPNGIKSDFVTVKSVKYEDIESLELTYDGISFLTNHEWSVVRDFKQTVILKNGTRLETNRDLYPITSLNMELPIQNGAFTESGLYECEFSIGPHSSNKIVLNVREAKEVPQYELPVVFHFIEQSRLLSEVSSSLVETNALFAGRFSDPSENSNKISTGISFRLASTAPDGSNLSPAGVNIIRASNDGTTSFSSLESIVKNNYWDPNKYVNVYVAKGDYSVVTGSFNPGGFANTAAILGPGLPGMFSLPNKPTEPLLNYVVMNGFMEGELLAHELGHLLSLNHPFNLGCISHGDDVYDTYVYEEGSMGDIIRCDGNTLRSSNIMDYIGSKSIFTYGQRERFLLMMEKGLFIPTPDNLNDAVGSLEKGNIQYKKITPSID